MLQEGDAEISFSRLSRLLEGEARIGVQAYKSIV